MMIMSFRSIELANGICDPCIWEGRRFLETAALSPPASPYQLSDRRREEPCGPSRPWPKLRQGRPAGQESHPCPCPLRWLSGLGCGFAPPAPRSEERRVGKECRARGARDHSMKDS